MIRRGIVISKRSAYDQEHRDYVYMLELRCEEDPACEIDLVVSKDIYDASVIQGFGKDTIIEYGDVLRIAPKSSGIVNYQEYIAACHRADAAEFHLADLRKAAERCAEYLEHVIEIIEEEVFLDPEDGESDEARQVVADVRALLNPKVK